MISFDEAIERIRSLARPIGTETVPIAGAAGRVLASSVTAKIDSPRSDVSSMDGYAVQTADLEKLPARLKIVGRSSPGNAFSGIVARGTCARIFTGAPVPQGADQVVIQEHVEADGEIAIINGHEKRSEYVRKRASDFAAGDMLLPKGRRLDARGMVAAAGGDTAYVEVFRRPRLKIVSTGDELAEPGRARESDGCVPDSVSIGIATLAEQYGASCTECVRVRDDLRLMEPLAAAACKDCDLVVVTGGASVGEKDFAKAMFAPLGLRLVFSGVSMKPGKPVWLARAGSQLVLGLPGNPTSALVTARLLMAPLLAMMQGLEIESVLAWRTSPLNSPIPPCGERETFHRAVLKDGAVEVLSFNDSGAQKILADATILVRQPAGSPASERGELVHILDL